MNENPNQAVEQDPLAVPTGDYNTDYPVLKAGTGKVFTITKIEVVDASDDAKSKGAPANAKNLKVSLATTEDQRDVNDVMVFKGFIVSKYIPLYASGKRSIEDVKKDLATLNKAALGVEAAKSVPFSEARDNPLRFANLPVACAVTVNPEKGSFPMSNSIRFMIPT